MFAHIPASFTEGEASSLGVLREHSALIRHQRPSFGDVWLEPRGGKWKLPIQCGGVNFIKQVISWIVSWSGSH